LSKVILFGTGRTSQVVREALKENVEIVAFADNNRTKWGEEINNVLIIDPESIRQYIFDYIIIASQFNEEIYKQLISMEIEENKIFQFYKSLDSTYNYYKRHMELFEEMSGIETLVTGISYALSGFNEECFLKKSFKFAFYSQDLYYDYKTAKYLIENKYEKIKSIRHVLIGLCYYSFQYDLSLSSISSKVLLYYEVLNDCHHKMDVEKVFNEFKINKDIGEKIIRKDEQNNYNLNWSSTGLNSIEDKWETGRKQAEIDCRKDYPETVRENTQVFKNYLNLLKEKNIKPIVVVYPASKYYTMCFSSRIENEFKRIIHETHKEYDFQYYDFFRLELFNDSDFEDVSHLNVNGSVKFTNILNNTIEF
jgi:hypothetical protein